MLQNRIYWGEIVHKEQPYPGEHTPIIDQERWDMVQVLLDRNAAQRNAGGRAAQPSLLAGLMFDADGNRMTPSHAVKDRQAGRGRGAANSVLLIRGLRLIHVLDEVVDGGLLANVPSFRAFSWCCHSGYSRTMRT
jgi:hypothetical protein